MNIEIVVRKVEIENGGNGKKGKGLIDIEEIEIIKIKESILRKFEDRENGGSGEEIWIVGIGWMEGDERERGEEKFLWIRWENEKKWWREIGNGRGIGRS